jgi:hypothetical protein
LNGEVHGTDGDDWWVVASISSAPLAATPLGGTALPVQPDAQVYRVHGGAGHDRLWLLDGSTMEAQDDADWSSVEEVRFASAAVLGEAAPHGVSAPQNRLWLPAESDHLRVVGGAFTSNHVATGSGRDTVWGGGASDVIHGGAGDDRLDGGASADELHGGLGHDWVAGGEGNDWLMDSDGYSTEVPDNDTMVGGEGADTITVWTGRDVVDLREQLAAPDLLRFFNTPGTTAWVWGFTSGQDQLELQVFTSAMRNWGEDMRTGFMPTQGDVFLDTTVWAEFRFDATMRPLSAHDLNPWTALCTGALRVPAPVGATTPGNRAVLIAFDETSQSSWFYSLNDVNRDGVIAGADEMHLLLVLVGTTVQPQDVF